MCLLKWPCLGLLPKMNVRSEGNNKEPTQINQECAQNLLLLLLLEGHVLSCGQVLLPSSQASSSSEKEEEEEGYEA